MLFLSDLLAEIFEYLEDDYKSLYSCILINKQWNVISIPKLWRNPFHSERSIRMIISCLLVEDKEFLVKNKPELKFLNLPKEPPLYNYAEFATKLDYNRISTFEKYLRRENNFDLLKMIMKFILKYSKIREFTNHFGEMDWDWLTEDPNYNSCFCELNELIIGFSSNHKFIKRLISSSKNIKSIKIFLNYCTSDNRELAELIKTQNKISKLTFFGYHNLIFSDYFKEAILTHSKSITFYGNHGGSNLDSILIKNFLNLKHLKLSHFNRSYHSIEGKLNSSLFTKIESLSLDLYNESFLSSLLEFVKSHKENLKKLEIMGMANDTEHLKEILRLISINCQNLEYLTIFYQNKLDQELTEIFNKCKKINFVRLIAFDHNPNCTFDGDKIIKILNEVLPKKLKRLEFNQEVTIYNKKLLNLLIRNWKGSKLFTIVSVKVNWFESKVQETNRKLSKTINSEENDFTLEIIENNTNVL